MFKLKEIAPIIENHLRHYSFSYKRADVHAAQQASNYENQNKVNGEDTDFIINKPIGCNSKSTQFLLDSKPSKEDLEIKAFYSEQFDGHPLQIAEHYEDGILLSIHSSNLVPGKVNKKIQSFLGDNYEVIFIEIDGKKEYMVINKYVFVPTKDIPHIFTKYNFFMPKHKEQLYLNTLSKVLINNDGKIKDTVDIIYLNSETKSIEHLKDVKLPHPLKLQNTKFNDIAMAYASDANIKVDFNSNTVDFNYMSMNKNLKSLFEANKVDLILDSKVDSKPVKKLTDMDAVDLYKKNGIIILEDEEPSDLK